MNMKQMKNASNLHAANATSVVGNSMATPSRSIAVHGTGSTIAQPPAMPMAVSAAQVGQMNLSHVRSAAFKPAVPVAGANVVLPSTGASSGVSNTAGDGALQLSGRWSLDREDSDSTNDYLEAMGLPLIARQAADKLDLMVIVNQTPGDFVITRRTRIFTETKHLKFGQEVNVNPEQTHQYPYVGPTGRMHVELNLTLTEKPPVNINRYFKKTSESTSLENLPAFDMSLETAGDVKRKR
ncbi:unnamed protein product [Peronospora destructor]|uniref:Uncharacterized protein n=1 Tax=Peronospora destructor TaxID=86335 RepID=A0AAV0VDG0_9STRA|nr:unnamed protein product [Peronospora destructor]